MGMVLNELAKAQHELAYGLLREWVASSRAWGRADPIVNGLAHFMRGQDLQEASRPVKGAPGLPTPDVSVPEIRGAVVNSRV